MKMLLEKKYNYQVVKFWKKILIIDFVFCCFVLNLIIFYAAFQNFIYPAYLSTLMDCSVIDENKLEQIGYYVAGEYDYSNDTITLYDCNNTIIEPTIDSKTLMHELCHKYQHDNNLSHNCNTPFYKFMDELTCYTIAYFY